MSTTQPARTTPQASRTDADETIDWENVAVETEVMLRLQQAPPVASARQGKPPAAG